MARGRDDFADHVVDEKISISDYPLSASVACGKVRRAFSRQTSPRAQCSYLLHSSAAPWKSSGTSSKGRWRSYARPASPPQSASYRVFFRCIRSLSCTCSILILLPLLRPAWFENSGRTQTFRASRRAFFRQGAASVGHGLVPAALQLIYCL